MHFSFTRVCHLMHPMGNPDENYVSSIAKIPASSLILCTDAYLHRLYLMDLNRPYAADASVDEVSGYHRNDLAISSIALMDGEDGAAVCADICCDWSGHNIYALILSTDGRGAWIKVYRHVERTLSYTGMRYRIPQDTHPLDIVLTLCGELTSLGPSCHLGMPVRYNDMCYGAGIEFIHGYLFVLTRREVEANIITHFRQDAVQDKTRNLYRLRLYEKRSAMVQFSLLSMMNANSGENVGNFYLSYPGTTENYKHDAVFHGLTQVDGKLITQIRHDHSLVPSDLTMWHLEEAKWHDESPRNMDVTGFIKHENAVVDEGKPVALPANPSGWVNSDQDFCTKATRLFQERVAALALGSTSIDTPQLQTRGQTVLVSIERPGIQPVRKSPLPLLPYKNENHYFPFGISMAYSLSEDNAERKMYGVYGNQIWVFDVLDYTLIVRHPKEDGSYEFFEGDIIDMSNVLEANRSELQCFIRNDTDFDMRDVHLIIEANEDDARWEDLFLSASHNTVGHKDLSLGDILPHGSKEFWVEIHPLNVQWWEDGTMHAIPLRVKYSTEDDYV